MYTKFYEFGIIPCKRASPFKPKKTILRIGVFIMTMLCRLTPDWQTKMEDETSTVKVIVPKGTVRYLIDDNIEYTKSDLKKYLFSMYVLPQEDFYFSTPKDRLTTGGSEDKRFNKKFKLFSTKKEIELYVKTIAFNNSKPIIFDIWKPYLDENSLIIHSIKSYQINKFYFKCTKCNMNCDCENSDYAEYKNYYYMYEEDNSSIEFLCKKCSGSSNDIQIVL